VYKKASRFNQGTAEGPERQWKEALGLGSGVRRKGREHVDLPNPPAPAEFPDGKLPASELPAGWLMQAQGNSHRLALLKDKLVPLLKGKPSPDTAAALLNAGNTLTNSGKPWTGGGVIALVNRLDLLSKSTLIDQIKSGLPTRSPHLGKPAIANIRSPGSAKRDAQQLITVRCQTCAKTGTIAREGDPPLRSDGSARTLRCSACDGEGIVI